MKKVTLLQLSDFITPDKDIDTALTKLTTIGEVSIIDTLTEKEQLSYVLIFVLLLLY